MSKFEHATAGRDSSDRTQRSLQEARSLIQANPKCMSCGTQKSAVVASRGGKRQALCLRCHDDPSRGRRSAKLHPLASLRIRQFFAERSLERRSDNVDLVMLSAKLVELGNRLSDLAADKPDMASVVAAFKAAGLSSLAVDSLLEQIGY
jgi:hypothetical protein